MRNGADGADGIGIEDAEVNADGELVLILTDESTINVGTVAGVGISDISLENYELTITLTNGTVLELGNIRGEQGEDGKSAYELAVENGYEGTLEEWLDSLYGGHDKLLTAEAEKASAGKTRGSGIYTSGESVTIEALPFIGYDFIGWYDGEELVSAEEEYTFTMPSDNTTYEARFEKAAGFENFCFTSDLNECEITGYDGFPGEELIIPEGVTRIGDYAFGDLHNVKTLVIADSVTYVGAHAFDGEMAWHEISEIHIGDNIEYIAEDAFGFSYTEETYFTGDIGNLFDIETRYLDSIYGLFAGKFYVNGELLTDLVVPEGVTRINDYILYDYDLNSLTLPASIEYIGESTFGNIGTVYYEGTREEWQNVSVNSGYITGSNVYYYSETDPGAYGNYWHYENGEVVPWYVNVTFYLGIVSGEDTTMRIPWNTAVERPEDPTCDYYVFCGWYNEPSCLTPYDFDVPVTENITIYAGWTRDSSAGAQEYVFEAENTNLNGKTYPGLSGTASAGGLIQSYTTNIKGEAVGASGGKYVGYMTEEGANVTFQIVSDAEVSDATIVLRLSKELGDYTFNTSNYSIELNAKPLQFSPIEFKNVPSLNEATDLSNCYALPFEDFVIAENVTLEEGLNSISCTVMNSDGMVGGTITANGPLIDCLKITTSAVLEWSAADGLPMYY